MRCILAITILAICLLFINATIFAQFPVEKIYSPKEVDQKIVVTSRPEARHTNEACEKGVFGVVLLQAIFASDRKVKNIEVLEGLPAGLTESAIKAARKIKFRPALKDGQPVSVSMKIEYNFGQNPPTPCR